MHRIFEMAVYPLKVLTTNPLPRGFTPKPALKARAWLYPAKDATLLSDVRIPLTWQVFFGLMNREGFRVGEALRLDGTDFDLGRVPKTSVQPSSR